MNHFWKYKVDHVIFWLLTISFHAYTHLSIVERAGAWQFLLELVVRNGLLAIVIYSTLFIVIPRFFEKKLILSGAVILLCFILSYIMAKNAHDYYLYHTILSDPLKKGFLSNSFYNLSIVLFYLTFSVTLHLSKQWYLQREHIRKIEHEKLNTELEYLKAQINPHFLFNSINTIYFQIDKQNQSARNTLSRFADMLRYQLYECNGKEIPIEKEISYLKNYVELQKMRKDENYRINFQYSDNLQNFTIIPLLLIPFVENAFKHVSHFTDKPNLIEIQLERLENLFSFQVYNTKDHITGTTENGGIGLKNVKRRLDLLYQNNYKLEFLENPESFEVKLTLTLNAPSS